MTQTTKTQPAGFAYDDLLPLGSDTTDYRLVTEDGVSAIAAAGRTFLSVDPEALTHLTATAFYDISHYLRTSHLQQLRSILDDPEASPNDKFVATELLHNANIAAGGVLPMCQDTGTAVITGYKGEQILTDTYDAKAIAEGVYNCFQTSNLRYSQLAPLDMFTEINTRNNLPAQIEIHSKPGNTYELFYMAKGGGSANKSFLYQETKALLNEKSLLEFCDSVLRKLGTAACPPYHLAVVVGGTTAEYTLKTAKLASAKYLDTLPTSGNATTGHGFRDLEWEQRILEMTRTFGIGAQFGGKYFCHDVRVIRLPRHGASNPVGIAVSCSADRQARAKITVDGLFLERLETDPARFLLETTAEKLSGEVVEIDLNKPMPEIQQQLTRYPVKTRLALTGTLVVARDIAHARIAELLDSGRLLPQYLRDHPVYYAGPAKTPTGHASGSFGPTTAGRMDPYVTRFQAEGGSLVMLAKGNRSDAVTKACARYGGFYLGSIGGPAARLAQDSIRKVELLEYPELGMEAVWRIEVENFPAFIVVDDKGNNFYAEVTTPVRIGSKA